MSTAEARGIKKRLMFVAGEDFNFLTYTTLILLSELGSTSPRHFADHRRLGFLVDFVANSRLPAILLHSTEEGVPIDGLAREHLIQAHTQGTARVPLMARLLPSLARRGMLELELIATTETLNVRLAPNGIPPDFVSQAIFEAERRNIRALRRYLPRLRTMTLETTLERLFGRFGVATWHD